MMAILISTSMADLAPGTKAPEFSAKNQDGKEIKSSDLKGKYVILYFYPKDDTPGCTKQACRFRDEYSKFKELGAEVFGVSKQDQKSHQKFKAKYKLPFDLLVDNDGTLAEKFDVKRLPIIGFHKRQTIVIGKDGTVLKFFPNADPTSNADEILELLKKN